MLKQLAKDLRVTTLDIAKKANVSIRTAQRWLLHDYNEFVERIILQSYYDREKERLLQNEN